MPKRRRDHSSSFDQSEASSSACTSKDAKLHKLKKLLGSEEDVIALEQARCPICMEHPHSAVLLRCSSYKNGCRPYMCNTGYCHSNCLNEFLEKFATPSEPQDNLPSNMGPQDNLPSNMEAQEDPVWSTEPELIRPCGSLSQQRLQCPLCRGQVFGWVVRVPARQYLNSKQRSCSHETCDFVGSYAELRKHARLEHPSVRPWAVDQKRKRDWECSEHVREVEDILSVIHSEFRDTNSDESELPSVFDYRHSFSLFARLFATEDEESETIDLNNRR